MSEYFAAALKTFILQHSKILFSKSFMLFFEKKPHNYCVGSLVHAMQN